MERYFIPKGEDAGPVITAGLLWSNQNRGKRVVFECEGTPRLVTPVDIDLPDLRIHATFDFGMPMECQQASGAAIRLGGLKNSVIDGLGLLLFQENTIGLDFGGTQGSSSCNHIVRPFVEARAKGCTGIRVGDAGDDYSAFEFHSPAFRYPIGSGNTSDPKTRLRAIIDGGFFGFQWSGGNNMAHTITNMTAVGCHTVSRALPDRQTGRSSGGKANTFVGGASGWCGTVFAVDGGYGITVLGGRYEHVASLLTHGNAFNEGRGRGPVTIHGVEVGDPLPYWNREFGIGADGVVIAINSAGPESIQGLRLEGWRQGCPASPVVRRSADKTMQTQPVFSGYIEGRADTTAV
jgi:hypothetical protein